jgi:hypothetical protein
MWKRLPMVGDESVQLWVPVSEKRMKQRDAAAVSLEETEASAPITFARSSTTNIIIQI